jgi:hypothetical protein
MKSFFITYKETELRVEAEVEPYRIGNDDLGTEIEIKDITLNGEDVYNLVCEIRDWEQEITNLIREQL